MAQCVICGTQTTLYVNGSALCLACDEKREDKNKPQEFERTSSKSDQKPA